MQISLSSNTKAKAIAKANTKAKAIAKANTKAKAIAKAIAKANTKAIAKAKANTKAKAKAKVKEEPIDPNKYNLHLPTKLTKKAESKDAVRYEITKFLTLNNLDIRHKKHLHFADYLGRKDFLAEIYLILCCGFYDTKESLSCMKKIVTYFEREWNTITFKELFELDPEWIPFFTENAHSDGTPRSSEFRKGVCKTRCTDIMKIKNLLTDPEKRNLLSAIILYDFINLRNFLGKNHSDMITTFISEEDASPSSP